MLVGVGMNRRRNYNLAPVSADVDSREDAGARLDGKTWIAEPKVLPASTGQILPRVWEVLVPVYLVLPRLVSSVAGVDVYHKHAALVAGGYSPIGAPAVWPPAVNRFRF